VTRTSWLQNKHIVLGVSGGIACYKACELTRELGRRGALVQIVMTEAATAFVSPLTFQALTSREVRISVLDAKAEAGMSHIELARWADLIIIAPCTANTLAQLASGQASDLLTTLWIASDCEKAIAPAMNQQMWKNIQTQENLTHLVDRGVAVIGPNSGLQACGDIGSGRMTEPTEVVNTLESQLTRGPLAHRKVLITAGPTHEPIDPVRYLANRSSGKMGFALADAASRLGGSVTLISGPAQLETPAGVARIDVETAREMLIAVESSLGDTDIFIGAAAVCDVRPAKFSTSKLKKSINKLSTIEFTENEDIIKVVANSRQRPTLVIGFAAETDSVLEKAKEKLVSKSLDAVIANCVANGDIFGQDNTQVTLIQNDMENPLPPGTKAEVAMEIMTLISEFLSKRI